MPHSWNAFEKAKKIVDMLVETGCIPSEDNHKKMVIQGQIQIILEE
jgi:predicted transcriptional regulator